MTLVVSREALIEAMVLPASRLALAVRSENAQECHRLLSPLDVVELQAMCVVLASMIPVDDVAPELMALVFSSSPRMEG
jgi:hypothetical protein